MRDAVDVRAREPARATPAWSEPSRSLVARAQLGDARARAQLMAVCTPAIRGHFAKVLRGSPDAEDASQHVLLRVLESLPRYRREAAPFGAWVFAIARNHAIDRARVSHRTEPVAPAEIAVAVDALGEAESEESVTQQRSAILELIEPLPRVQRRVIELLYLHDLSHRDAARILGRTEASVRQLHKRARDRLRELIEAYAP